ncbi:MAG TPA: hypothetical protein VE783_09140 [Candidatus Limnocylindrales bacterium]|jgi:hypothetical protein|nr:hypothetical protein [Candidatus Limnocylindrales bacterium]
MKRTVAILNSFAALAVLAVAGLAGAQNPELRERVAEIKQTMAQNKAELAQYTWQEQQTISVKGEVKKQSLFQVRLGPDGKPQKQPLGSPDQQASSGGRRHGLKHRVVEKKKEEFEEYAQQIAQLAQGYMQPDPGRLQQLFEQGNVSLGPAGVPGEVRLMIQNYLKPGDTVTLIFNRSQKMLQSLQISSYLNDPSDAVTIAAQFSRLANGPSHVSDVSVNGVKKQLLVQMQNSNYQGM